MEFGPALGPDELSSEAVRAQEQRPSGLPPLGALLPPASWDHKPHGFFYKNIRPTSFFMCVFAERGLQEEGPAGESLAKQDFSDNLPLSSKHTQPLLPQL